MFAAAETLVRETVRRLLEIEVFDRSMVLAAQAFTAFFPLVIVVESARADRGEDSAAAFLIERFRLTGEAARSVRSAFAAPAEVTGSTTAIGLVILVVSALAFTRALQRVYERAWSIAPRGLRGTGDGLIWLAAFALYLVAVPSVHAVLGEGSPGVAGALALAAAVWLFTPWLLLGRRVAWRALVPQAVCTAVTVALVGTAFVVVMPPAVANAAEQFGLIGVAFALITWLFSSAVAISVSAVLGAELAQVRRPSAAGVQRRA